MSSQSFRKIQVAFWALFVLIPVVTGLLSYHWLPNESYDEDKHELLQSHSEAGWPEGQTSHEVPDRWRDEKTGEIFTPADFARHRKSEAERLFVTSFAYGLIGCLFYAYCRFRDKKAAYAVAFKKALLINFAVSLFIYWLT